MKETLARFHLKPSTKRTSSDIGADHMASKALKNLSLTDDQMIREELQEQRFKASSSRMSDSKLHPLD